MPRLNTRYIYDIYVGEKPLRALETGKPICLSDVKTIIPNATGLRLRTGVY